ncbi:hypothetical protein [Acinetobacter haemolyticus]|nr:hypothetical protein [Acinetobacter haemolyticus]
MKITIMMNEYRALLFAGLNFYRDVICHKKTAWMKSGLMWFR